ncbi:conserved hypothetical protein [gamma proteobacterium HdN1]|nr:conserved hypothetical protein [gamma proteobacterium HdN1]
MMSNDTNPLLSIIVIVYDMPRQAMNTLMSLSAGYQLGVDATQYEVIVVENSSANLIPPTEIRSLPSNFQYYCRDNLGVSPASAINFAALNARGKYLGLMIDGARMVSPGVIRNVLMAFRANENALVVVPGYHLGHQEQQYHLTHAYTEASEIALLESIAWPKHPYRLFEIAVWSGANSHGFFHPFMESNCLFMPFGVFDALGRADERFQCPGGGMLNLDIYRRAALHLDTELFMLAGEGSFHQLHGGVTTSEVVDRKAILRRQLDEYATIRDTPFRSPTIEPILLGKFSAPALQFLKRSAERGEERFKRFAASGEHPFADELLKFADQPTSG